MKRIDFTKSGGFPLTQDQLGYLQTAFTEVMPNIIGFRNPGTNIAVRLSGMISTSTFGTTTVSAGWFLYNSTLVRFGGGTYGSIALGHAIYVQIATNGTSLTFNDGSTPTVIYDQVAGLVQLVSSTAESGTLFKLTNLQDFCRETNWTVVNFSSYLTGLGVSGSISYKKDYLANTLYLKGDLVTTGPSSGIDYIDTVTNGTVMFTLPTNYRPSSKVPFLVKIWTPYQVSDSGSTLNTILNSLVGCVDSSGVVYIGFVNGGPTLGAYFRLSVVLPLD